ASRSSGPRRPERRPLRPREHRENSPRSMNFARGSYATNIGAGIFVERSDYRFACLENKTEKPFITGDQSVINLNTEKDKELRLYMPLSPSLAIIFTRDVSIPNTKIVKAASSIEVEYYNQMIYRNSADQIYSNNRNYLTEVSKSAKNILAAY